MITLENREARLRIYEIPISIGGGEKHVVGSVDRISDTVARAGSIALRTRERAFPTTLTLTARNTPGSITEPLPDAYAEAPAVRAALAAGQLVKRDVLPAPAPMSTQGAEAPPTEKATPMAFHSSVKATDRKE